MSCSDNIDGDECPFCGAQDIEEPETCNNCTTDICEFCASLDGFCPDCEMENDPEY